MSASPVSASVTVKGFAGNISVNDGGSGAATPVLFVHSFAGSAAQWLPQLDHLRDTRRAIAFDWRGHGESDPSPTNDYSIQAVAEDIAVVADQLSLSRFVLVGHSTGAAAAIAYAGSHADRVAGLVVEGIGGRMDGNMSKPIIDAIDSNFDEKMAEYWTQLLANASLATQMLVKRDRAVLTKSQSLAMIHANFAYDPVPDLNQYDGPKQTIISTMGDTQFALHRLTPGLPVHIMDGTSHWMHLDRPFEFNQLLDEFLAKPSVNGG
ncbi:MAG: alpha/beta hydrolase [Phycisphaerae bacterium]|nr:alpha/beta hydrolase [Gemmatimonadaceae bacterium]